MDLVIRAERETRAEEGVNALKAIMRDAQSNRALLLKFVLDGKRKFVNVVSAQLRGYLVSDRQIELVWIWMFHRRGPDPKAEFEQLCEAAVQRKYKEEAEEAELAMLYDRARRRMD